MPIRGSCLCNSLRFELASQDDVVGPFEICHCTRCRKSSGGAGMPAVMVRTSGFRWLTGTELIQKYAAPLIYGPPAYHAFFCSRCGSPVPPALVEDEYFEIAAGLFDDDPGIRPDKHIFVELLPSWDSISDPLPQFDKVQLAEHRGVQLPADFRSQTHYDAASTPAIAAVLFDIGGVLIELGGIDRLLAMTADDCDREEVWRRWVQSPNVHALETGALDPETFAARYVEEGNLNVDPAAFLADMPSWASRLLPGAVELMHQVRATGVRVAALSNTNAPHAQAMRATALWSLFDAAYLSYEMGCMKPSPEIFEQACDNLGLPPQQVVFVDDSPRNVIAARAAGLTALQVEGPEQARAALISTGVLTD